MAATSLDLSQIKTDALSSAATFRTLIGLGSSDSVTFAGLTLSEDLTATSIVASTGVTFKSGYSHTINFNTSTPYYSMHRDFGARYHKNLKFGWTAGIHATQGGMGLGFVHTDTATASLTLADGVSFGALQISSLLSHETLNVYNTYTSDTSFENLQLQWNTNEARIGTSVGSAGGTQRVVAIGSWNSSGVWTSAISYNPSSTIALVSPNGKVNFGSIGNVQIDHSASRINLGTGWAGVAASGTGLDTRLLFSLNTATSVKAVMDSYGALALGGSSSPAAMLDIKPTWNDGATEFTGLKLDVTDTASASASLLMDLQVGGSSKFSVSKNGVLKTQKITNTTILSSDPDIITITGDSNWGGNNIPTFSVDMNWGILKNWNKYGQGEVQYGAAGGLSSIRFIYGSGSIIKSQGVDSCVSSSSRFGILNNGYLGFNGSTQITGPFNVRLYRDADNILAQRNDTNAQTFRLYNTYTSSTSFENLQLQWNTNEARIGTSVGSSGGTQRVMNFGVWDSSGTWKSMLSFNDTTQLLTIPSPYTLSVVLLQLSGLYAQIRGHLGNITLTNHTTANDFGLLRFGGILNTYPAIKRNGTALNFRLADDSADCGITASTGVFSGQLTNAIGTITASTPVTFTQTWNDGATTFTGLKLDITDTASASASLLMDLQVGGGSVFNVGKLGPYLPIGKYLFLSAGNVHISNRSLPSSNLVVKQGVNLQVPTNFSDNGFAISNISTGWSIFESHNLGVVFGHRPNSVALYVSTANELEQRNSTNAQTFRLYNTYTSSTSFENLQLQWNTNEARIGTSVGSAGGTQRDVVLGSWDSAGTWNPALTITPQGVPTFSMGTVTSSQPFTVTQTWNDGATTFTGILANITDTASSAASLLMNLQIGGSSVFNVGKSVINYFGTTNYALRIQNTNDGTAITAGGLSNNNNTAFSIGSGTLYSYSLHCGNTNSATADYLFWSLGTPVGTVNSKTGSGSVVSFRSTGIKLANASYISWAVSHAGRESLSGTDLVIAKDAANILAQRNGTNAQTFRLYNTYTSDTSYERGKLEWSSNVFRIGTEKGSAGGSARAMELQTDGVTKLTVTTGGTLTVPETVTTPTGTTTTVDLEAGNHQTLDLGSASGDVTVTLAVPSASSAGTIILLQGATPRDVAWTPSSGSIVWMGGEPDWNSDPSNTSRVVAWRWNGTDLRLAPSEASV